MNGYMYNKVLLFFIVLYPLCIGGGAEISLQKTPAGYDVLIDKQIFAGYITDFQGTPIVYPIIGPTGKKMTRDYPMNERKDETEITDHPHHRSLWFTHSNVNGLDFWTAEHQTKQTQYKIIHRKFHQAKVMDNTAVIQTENEWIGKDNEPVCLDVRTLHFGLLDDKRYIDLGVTVKALQDKVVFGDVKDGTFGLRVPGTMSVTAKERHPTWGGHFVNAEGLTDAAAWGKQSNWIDYYGPVEGETLGIAVLNHPSSFRYPTYWHIREYGLVAANPFGVHTFGKNPDKHSGDLALQKGGTFTVSYRIVLHKGTAKEAGIAQLFEQYRNKENFPHSR
ncbi:MAG: PmoA family protein [Planctomycetaceae bacterium]|jgi:hypothetical protein|nr:PmoA family protein [Planctomycetaceae bacterium]